MVIVVLAMFLPEKNASLPSSPSRSPSASSWVAPRPCPGRFFSLLIPRGREGGVLQPVRRAAERGTSWFGTLLFGVVFQVTGSYRPAILALIIFFVPRCVLPAPARPRQGIREAGNRVPRGIYVSDGVDCCTTGILSEVVRRTGILAVAR